MKTNPVCSLVIFLLVMGSEVIKCSVTYDNKAVIINGKRRILLSGSIHYPRSTPQMWEDVILKAKNAGLDVIDTYVFWNGHEPSPANYNFEGRYDVVRFVKTVQKLGLYVHLRIGPYVCAEWNFGGFPVWLKYVPGMSFRTDNEPFKAAMQQFSQKIVGMMKSEKLFESQGGPIILSQIENEYGAQRKAVGAAGEAYMNWAAKMAVGLDTGVPWVMCKDESAPDPVINTCNGFYCDSFSPNKPYKPTMWTEAWTGWFTEFGGTIHQRPVQDLAFAVTRFIQKGGSYINYYMFHGGTNFGRTAGGPFVTTSYDYDAPIDEYGLIREPKYGHLKELHKAIKLCEHALVSSDPTVTSLGSPQQLAHVFSSGEGSCAAFLSNFDNNSSARVMFNNRHYNLPPWSISILPDCETVVFNTAKVGTQTSKFKMLPADSQLHSWDVYGEDTASLEQDSSTFTALGLLEQINVTRDDTDYLWYITSVNIASSESFLRGGEKPTLSINSRGHALHVFINSQLAGSAYGTRRNTRFTFSGPVKLQVGINKISLLSIAMGLPNNGLHFEDWTVGILGPVELKGLDQGKKDLSRQTWSYKVGLSGEKINLVSPDKVEWTRGLAIVQNQRQPLRWYKAYFDAPSGDEPLALDMRSMGKGQVWINGQSIGRYWTAIANGNCGVCHYAGAFRAPKCQLGCAKPTQRWYHVPRSWLQAKQNVIVVLEEVGGDPSKITFVRRSRRVVCANTVEHHPMVANYRAERTQKMLHQAKIHLHCAPGQNISSIKFASFGTPTGTCGSFQIGKCHAHNSHDLIEQMCLGKESCRLTVSNSYFGSDPCPNVLKKLSVEVSCETTQ